MKKILLIGFILFSEFAYAEWTLVSRTVGGDEFSIDFSTIKVINGNKRAWILSNYNEPLKSLGKPIYSIVDLVEFNCYESKYRSISSTAYAERNGSDSVKTLSADEKWTYPAPNTSFNTVLNQVCRR